jgi:ankyrin repeat protein
VKFLLESGADLNAQTTSGRTALMYAVQLGHLNLVVMLLGRKELLLEASDLEGYTALIIAIEMGEPGAIAPFLVPQTFVWVLICAYCLF